MRDDELRKKKKGEKERRRERCRASQAEMLNNRATAAQAMTGATLNRRSSLSPNVSLSPSPAVVLQPPPFAYLFPLLACSPRPYALLFSRRRLVTAALLALYLLLPLHSSLMLQQGCPFMHPACVMRHVCAGSVGGASPLSSTATPATASMPRHALQMPEWSRGGIPLLFIFSSHLIFPQDSLISHLLSSYSLP